MGIAMDLHCLVPNLANTSYHMAPGRIFPYGGTTAPEGYLMCDGSAVSRTEYSALFAVIGTTFGAGNGSTTFNLPNLQGRVPVGKDGSHALGTTGGSETVTLTKEQSGLPAHGHGFTQPTVNGGATTTGGGGGHSHSWNGYYTIPRRWDAGDEVKARSRTKISSDPTDTSTNSVANHTHNQVAHTHSVSGGAVSDQIGRASCRERV